MDTDNRKTPDAASQIESVVLKIHRRNGGALRALDFNLSLLDPALEIDSLDLAEIMVEVERRFHVTPFDAATPPRTWRELAAQIEGRPE